MGGMTAVSFVRRRVLPARPARYVLIAVGLSASAACLLPPDTFEPGTVRNYPPEIVLDSVSPRRAVLVVGTSCNSWRVSARVYDPDDDTVAIRFVTDNALNTAKVIEDRAASPAKSARPEDLRIVTAQDFSCLPSESMGCDLTHALSMFVTDAKSFAPTSSTATDFGRIDPGETFPDGSTEFSVVEYRWAINFSSSSDGMQLCPQP